MPRWPILLIFVCTSPALYGQEAPLRCRYISNWQTDFRLDSLTVIGSSIQLEPPAPFSFNPSDGFIRISPGSGHDSIRVCYSVIPYDLSRPYYRRSRVEELEGRLPSRGRTESQPPATEQREELFPSEQIQKSGSLSRGISFGNAQNVVLNSALNLQLEGKLTDDINVRASITDQNVPFQPEGNTAQIQDFDNVFVEMYNDKFSLRGGDIVLQNRDSEFLRYYKNVQGGLLQTDLKLGEKNRVRNTLGISMAKGKFASLQLEVQEGVSGPYRIRIPEASDFVIVIANSERVFLDGRLLERGFAHDYIIDYDRAEIQFMSRVLITKFSRVRIDVEYSDRNYSRRILAASHYQESGMVSFFANAYSERDNPNRPLTVELSDADRTLLQQVGDDLEDAVTVSGTPVPFSPDQILYEQIDTVDSDNRPYRIFRYSTSQAAQLYRVTFSPTGNGNGDYLPLEADLNGRAFYWVAPVNGVRQGAYSPETQLPAPNQKDMFNAGAGLHLSKYDELFAEMAFTKNDLNLFSELDSDDDSGYALKTGYRVRGRRLSFLSGYLLGADLNYEYNSRFFSPIDRFRYIEFDRDWSYDPLVQKDQTADNIFNAAVQLERDVFNLFQYRFSTRQRGDQVNGMQQQWKLGQDIWRFRISSTGFHMNNDGSDQRSRWNRFELDARYRGRVFSPGYTYRTDRNEVKAAETDSVISTAMNFDEHLFYLRSSDTLQTRFGVEHSIREDRFPRNGRLVDSDRANTTSLYVRTPAGRSNDLNFMLTYRDNLNFLSAPAPAEERTLMGRADWFGQFFNRHVRSDLTYAIGSGRELKRDFVYIRTETGLGTHTWRDDNGDGVQALSEFYLAVNPDERNFIKILLPTEEYVFAYENNFNYRLNIELPRSWRKLSGIKGLLSRFSANSSWSIIRRITSDDLLARLLPFYGNIEESDLLSQREAVRGRLFFNRSNPGFGFDVGYQRNGNKQLLINGFESRGTEEYSTNFRVNIHRKYSLRAILLRGRTDSGSDFLVNHNYAIRRSRVGPEIAWQPNTSVRVATEYAFSRKNSPGAGNEAILAEFHELTGTLRWNDPAKLMLNALIRYANISFNGVENSPLGYDMLEALRPGRNLNWSIVFQKKIFAGLQMSLNYEGRRSEGGPAIHIGRMQVSALF
jgi:hypothetical protein